MRTNTTRPTMLPIQRASACLLRPTYASPIRARPGLRPTDLRRGYNYSRGVTNAGQLDMGLLFVCFQADLAAGFLTIQARLNGERLEEYIKPVGGGYFFVLPGVQTKDDFSPKVCCALRRSGVIDAVREACGSAI